MAIERTKDLNISIREIYGNKIFYPINKYYATIIRIVDNAENNEDAINKLYNYYIEDMEFNSFVRSCETRSNELLNEHLKKYSGLNSCIAWIINNIDYKDDELNNVRDKIISYYTTDRQTHYNKINGSIIGNADNTLNIFQTIYTQVAALLIVNLINETCTRVFDILKDFKVKMINDNKDEGKANSHILEKLYLFNISEEKLDKFQNITVNRMDETFKSLPIAIRTYLVSQLHINEILFEKEFTNIEFLNDLLLKIEVSRNKAVYIIDPFKKAIS